MVFFWRIRCWGGVVIVGWGYFFGNSVVGRVGVVIVGGVAFFGQGRTLPSPYHYNTTRTDGDLHSGRDLSTE